MIVLLVVVMFAKLRVGVGVSGARLGTGWVGAVGAC